MKNQSYFSRNACVGGLFFALALLAGCTSSSVQTVGAAHPANWIKPYTMSVVQGNFVSKEQLKALKLGMTRAQVRDTLGTPLVASVFHDNRWDYVFTLKRQDTPPQSFKLTLFFKADLLDRFEGDDMPAEVDFIAKIDTARKFEKPPVLELSNQELKAAEEKLGLSRTPAPSKPAAAQTPPARNYPPLEGVQP